MMSHVDRNWQVRASEAIAEAVKLPPDLKRKPPDV
jgi:hypothetical protein